MQTSFNTSAPTTSDVQSVFSRYLQNISQALRKAITEASEAARSINGSAFATYYGQMQYHLGWVNEALVPGGSNPGKLLRPTLLLLAYEMTTAHEDASGTCYLQRALPAAAAIELIHNFTLIHDDIEDADAERRHRPTVWKVWGIPQAINAGDGMIFVARLALWNVLEEGVKSEIAVRLSQVLDRTVLTVTEGQYLDMSFENVLQVSVACYIDMIGRKTAALMSCAAEMGALLGCNDSQVITGLRNFGWALGLAFQVRDDLLGIWGSPDVSGKAVAGDIYRRKKSLPVLHALSTAGEEDLRYLQDLYQQQTVISSTQLEEVLAIFSRTRTKTYCQQFLLQQCQQARQALDSILSHRNPRAERAYEDMATLINFVAESV
ncbi:MAG TPA: polyprenyl synthetase family protein [Ktedonobacteraceae bacterium]|nr:polyprenyl synthetase family protein [Ktedonobacteraceae bacterium]